jgi:hypothetical protein
MKWRRQNGRIIIVPSKQTIKGNRCIFNEGTRYESKGTRKYI